MCECKVECVMRNAFKGCKQRPCLTFHFDEQR
jgi:hypothetical protein